MTQNTITMVAPQSGLMATEQVPVADGFQPLNLNAQQSAGDSWLGLVLISAIVLAALIAYPAYLWLKQDRQRGLEVNFTRSLFD